MSSGPRNPPDGTGEESAPTAVDIAPSTPTRADGPAGDLGGDSLSRYELGEMIGRGGLGEVLEAFDRDLRRTVALKRVRRAGVDPSRRAHLIEEAQITAQLEHPNIPAVHALGVAPDDAVYFTMTRIEGLSLAELIRERRTDPALRQAFTTRRMLRIFLQVAYALAFAHDRGVIHRDIKPENVMLGKFGEVRLVDWGLAKVIGRADAISGDPDRDHPRVEPLVETTHHPESVAGSSIGTPGYMSPEQVEGRQDLDARTDVYSLGAMLYEILAGRPPIREDSTAKTLLATVRGDIEPLDRVANLSEPLCRVVHTALMTARDDRYPDVMGMIRDVEAVLEGSVPTVHRETWLERAGRVYLTRSRRFGRLRLFDLDTLGAGSGLVGVAVGIWTAPILGGWALAILLVGLVLMAPFLYAMIRSPRPDDQLEQPFGEGVARASSLTGSLATSTSPPETPGEPGETTVASPLPAELEDTIDARSPPG